MSDRPVIAFHLVLSCYGFWLPNDPRGSNSREVRAEHLKPFGPATFVTHSRSVARKPHDRSLRLAAKTALKFDPIRFDGPQARAVAQGIAEVCRRRAIACYACAVMPEHTHLVIGQPHRSIDRIVAGLKAGASARLAADGLHPYEHQAPAERPPIWAKGSRHVFVFDHAGLISKIDYVNANPEAAGFPRQTWSFVRPVPPRTQ